MDNAIVLVHVVDKDGEGRGRHIHDVYIDQFLVLTCEILKNLRCETFKFFPKKFSEFASGLNTKKPHKFRHKNAAKLLIALVLVGIWYVNL